MNKGLQIIAAALLATFLAYTWDDPRSPLLIEPTPAHLCLPPSPPLLGPRPGQPMFPTKRVESEA